MSFLGRCSESLGDYSRVHAPPTIPVSILSSVMEGIDSTGEEMTYGRKKFVTIGNKKAENKRASPRWRWKRKEVWG